MTERLMPWDQLEAVMSPFYPQSRQWQKTFIHPKTMFRIHHGKTLVQHEDPAMEDCFV